MSRAIPLSFPHSQPVVRDRVTVPSVWLLAVWLSLAMFPLAAHFVTFHPDERHYTDGAVHMLHTGDYLTPRTADGTLRFNKPVVTYWLLLPWYQLLGVTPLAGRISFLILSAAIVCLTYQTAMLLYGDRRTGLWSAAMMGTHAPLLSVAVNSIPEVPLTLCWLLCAYGFLGIVVQGRREPIFYWAAYLGAGLGVAVKGMPILVLVAYAWAFALLNPWKPNRLRDLWHTPSMAMGLFVGLWWYVAMYAQHGNASLAMFMSDQVTERVGHSPLRFVKNLVAVGLCYVLTFLPWNLPLIGQFLQRKAGGFGRARLLPSRKTHSAHTEVRPPEDRSTASTRSIALAFVLGWAAVMGLVIALVERFALRYVLAVTPLLAIVLADQLRRLDVRLVERLSSRVSLGLSVLLAFTAVLMVLVHRQMHVPVGVSCVGLALVAVGLWLCRPTNPWMTDAPTRNSLAGLALVPIVFLTCQPLALPDSGTLFAQQARHAGLLGRSDLVYAGNPALVSKSRVTTGGQLPVAVLDDVEDLALPEYPRVILRADDLDVLPLEHYEVETEFAAGTEGLKPLPLLQALVQGKLQSYLHTKPQRFVVLRQRALEQGDAIAQTTNGRTQGAGGRSQISDLGFQISEKGLR